MLGLRLLGQCGATDGGGSYGAGYSSVVLGFARQALPCWDFGFLDTMWWAGVGETCSVAEDAAVMERSGA